VSCRPSRVSLAVTGSSGVKVALRILEALHKSGVAVQGVIVTRGALEVARYEEDLEPEELLESLKKYGPVYMENDFTSPLASSSNQPDAMAIVPASMKTVGLLAAGVPSNLVVRAALAILRLGRRLVVAPRETPLGAAELRNLLKIAEMGGLVVPLTLAFYNKPRTIDDMVNFAAGKVLDALGVEAEIYKRWRGPED